MVAGHLKNIYVYLLKIRAISMGKESCQNFSYRHIRKRYSAPWPPYLLTDPNSLNNFGRGSPKEHLCQITSKSSQWFWRRSLSKISYRQRRKSYKHIRKTYSAPWPPYLLTDPNSLNNFGRGSPKEHLCQIISKSGWRFWRRRLSKILLFLAPVT